MVHNQIHQYAIKYLRLGNNPKLIEKIKKVGLTKEDVENYMKENILKPEDTPAEPGNNRSDAPGTGESGTPDNTESGTPAKTDSEPKATPTDEQEPTGEANEDPDNDEGIATGVGEE